MKDSSPAWRKVLTPIELGMQRRLYGANCKRIPTVSDVIMWRVLLALRSHAYLECCRIWLVGSRVEPGKCGSDIDVVLSNRSGNGLSDRTIERALWFCRNFGLYATNPPVIVDPCFRHAGPTLEVKPLQPDAVVHSVKLFSPKIAQAVTGGAISKYRRVGYFSIDYYRPAGETNYYTKLPRRSFEGKSSSYLRPAIEVERQSADICC